MHFYLTLLAALTLAGCLLSGIEITLGSRKLAHLENIPPINSQTAPAISVVIPACNEALSIAAALRSVLRQDYPHYEVIAVNDRSTDATGTILEAEAAAHPRLRVIHIRDLPAGWLGKNHAMQKGGETASGALILFTDADIVMDPSVLSRAASWMESNRLDHLAIAPRARVGGFLSNAFLAVFAVLFTLYAKPWKVRDPKSRHHIGIGAFNMVRAGAWREVGGFTAIALRPDDDIKLGKLLKTRGFRQDFVVGTRLLLVEWYHSFPEMQRGLMKNMFAGADYSVTVILMGSIFQLAFLVWPFLAALVTHGVLQAMNVAIVALLLISFAVNAGKAGIRRWWALTLPVGTLVSVYLSARATIVTLYRGSIEWRGTRYPLDRLRSNRL